MQLIHNVMKPLSFRFKVLCIIGLLALIVVQQYRLINYGPNDIGAGNFTYNLIGQKYGFPLPSDYAGSSSPPAVKLWWHIIAFKGDQDKKGGIYTVGFMHTIQDGPSITKVQGQVDCRYEEQQKAFTLLNLQTYDQSGDSGK